MRQLSLTFRVAFFFLLCHLVCFTFFILSEYRYPPENGVNIGGAFAFMAGLICFALAVLGFLKDLIESRKQK